MNEVGIVPSNDSNITETYRHDLPTIFMPNQKAKDRFYDFFTAHIRNPNTRIAYYAAITRFSQWSQSCGCSDLTDIRPRDVSVYIEQISKVLSPATVKLQLAAIRAIFNWLIVGQIVEMNPAHPVRGPKLIVRKGKTPPLTAEDARAIFASIDTAQLIGLRDRALIGTMLYMFARVSATLALNVEDYYAVGRDNWMRLSEKGGKESSLLVNYTLTDYIDAYIHAAGIAGDPKGPLFRTSPGLPDRLTERRMMQYDAYRVIKRRSIAADVRTKLGNHSCRAGGITIYIQRGGTLERAQERAGHADIRTTRLYDHSERVESRAEVERVAI